MRITQDFRSSMNWLHTWGGLGVSALLFAIFWMGTLSVFDKEIDRWMIPEFRIDTPDSVSLDQTVLPAIEQIGVPEDASVFVAVPRERTPFIRMEYEDSKGYQVKYLNPVSGELIDQTDSFAGTGFIYPFHYNLHLHWMNLGIWMTGFASIAMMVLIVSGIFIHRKIIQDFFRFRPERKKRRALLDLHNLSGMILLPFHFLFPLTAIIIMATSYFHWSTELPFGGDHAASDKAFYGFEYLPPSGVPQEGDISIDQAIAAAEQVWAQTLSDSKSKVYSLDVLHRRDAAAYISLYNAYPEGAVTSTLGAVAVDASTGDILSIHREKSISATASWLGGLHMIQFDHWVLRWLYFFAGATGCVLIATGLLFWLESRINNSITTKRGIRVVRAMSIGAVTGIIMATAAFFLANRLLPKSVSFAEMHRHDLEIWAFFAVWVLAFLHAAIRDRKAWREQTLVIGITAIAAVLLNWVTTGDHLVATLLTGDIAIAVMDIMLLLVAACALAVSQSWLKGASLRQQNAHQKETPANG